MLSEMNAFKAEHLPNREAGRQVGKICAWTYAASHYLQDQEAAKTMTKLLLFCAWRKESGLLLYSFIL